MISGWSDPAFARIARILERRAGLSFGAGREPVAEAGIRRAMSRSNIHDFDRYIAAIEADDAPFHDLADELTTFETHFFRHPDQIEILRNHLVPDLLAARSPDHVFRLWSAGCATGEEPYTLAIVLDELGLGDRVHILATDISQSALARARRAEYGDWSLRGVPDEARRAHFEKIGSRFSVLPRFRRRVAFEHHNLALDTYPSIASGIWGLDLVFCRNVIIYFAPETTRAVARRLHDALAPGGFLVMGPSDAPLWDLAPLETLRTSGGIVYRRPGHGHAQPVTAPAPVEALSVFQSVDLPRAERPPARSARPPGASPHPTPPPPAPAPSDQAREVAAAFSAGDFARAVALARQLSHDPAACAVGARAVAALRGAVAAEQACADAALRHPLSVELCLLRTLMLLELGRLDEAAESARRTLCLDHQSPMAHFTAATIARRRADLAAARRGYRNARSLAAALPPDAVVPLTDGERAGRLAEAAAAQLALLDRHE
jgi:chemotaxis protein methyltransferase CheR